MAALLFLSTLHPNCYNSVWKEKKTGQQNNKISNSRMIDVFAYLIFVTGNFHLLPLPGCYNSAEREEKMVQQRSRMQENLLE